MSNYVQTNQTVLLGNSSHTISAANSGKIHILNTALTVGAKTLTLPPVEAGLNYKFIIGVPGAALGQISTLMPANAAGVAVNGILYGSVINNTGVVGTMITPKVIGSNTADFTANAVLGDYIELYSDGTYWYINGLSTVAAGLA